MARSFNFPTERNPRFWLQTGCAVLVLANLVAIYLLLAPPGGTRSELAAENARVRSQIASARIGTTRLRNVAAKVQLGSTQADNFESRLFLPRRTAYQTVIAEIQRMAKASGLEQRDAVYTQEPIEGSDDLTLLNVTANYQGTYQNLMQFLYQADKSPMLLMLDTLQAAPVQRGQQINTSIRFQAILREEAGGQNGGQP